jgi:type II secretory pathway pseudopilin PulG
MKKLKIFQKGFTLTELVFYMGLLIILIAILSRLFSSILDVQLESQSSSSVDLDGKYIISKLTYDMRSMQTSAPTNDTIITPASPGLSGSTLTFKVNSINYTYATNSGNLTLTNDNGSNNLNSTDTNLSNLQFTRIGSGTSTDTIRVSFTLTSKISRISGPETRTFQTTISSQ